MRQTLEGVMILCARMRRPGTADHLGHMEALVHMSGCIILLLDRWY
jgi:hypothetical protein